MKRATGSKVSKQTVTVKGRSYTRYVADLGTVNGKRTRRTFKTKREAEAELARHKHVINRVGNLANLLGDDQLRDAAAALEKLNGTATLKAAAEYYMSSHHPTGGRLTTQEALDGFLQSRVDKNLRGLTVNDYRVKLTPFAVAMGDAPVSGVTFQSVEAWLQGRGDMTPGTRKAYVRALRAFFQWCVEKRGLMPANPAKAFDLPREDKRTVTYLTADDAAKLLRAAVNTRPEIVPYIAIGMFAGLRPSELHGDRTEHGALDWRKIDFAQRIITVDPKQTKTRDGRRVEMSDNLVQWLAPYRRESGPVFYTRTSLAAVVKASGVDFPKDVLRHTCGTFYQAQHHHEGETASLLGDTIKTVKKHYVNPMISAEEATRFWAIRPEAESNMIEFSAMTA